MTLKTMYPAIANSPMTELAEAIDIEQTTIEVVDGSVLPNAPNVATIGTGEDAETIIYNDKNGNTLSNVERGFQGNAKAWGQGITVARMFTAYDYDSMRENIESVSTVANGAIQSSEKGVVGGVAKQDDVVILSDNLNILSNDLTGLSNEVDKHKAEKANVTELGHVKPDGTTITVDENGVISTAEMIASNVTIEDTEGHFTASNVEDALSELFTNVSNGKTLVGGAITDIDPSVNIPAEPTFQDLATVIGNMNSFNFIPGDDFFIIKDTPNEVTSTSFVLAKKLNVLFDGEGRLRYEVKRAGSGKVFSRFYLNGVLIEELSQESGITNDVAFTKDMNFKYGDDIEIHSRVYSSGQKVYVENFTISLKNTRSYFQKII